MTDLLSYLKSTANIKSFAETKNYYFDYHNCAESGNNNVKIRLDYELSSDLDDAILRIGVCEKCGLCLYHKDFRSKSSF
jgi:hypothetical protein